MSRSMDLREYRSHPSSIVFSDGGHGHSQNPIVLLLKDQEISSSILMEILIVGKKDSDVDCSSFDHRSDTLKELLHLCYCLRDVVRTVLAVHLLVVAAVGAVGGEECSGSGTVPTTLHWHQWLAERSLSDCIFESTFAW